MTTEWQIEQNLIPYNEALEVMEKRVLDIHNHKAKELVWLLEHPSLYTAGTSSNIAELLEPDILPVFNTGRGGKYTYHGPGQRIAYVMLDLKKRADPGEPDLRKYIFQLEEWLINVLFELGIKGERRDGRVGIWVTKSNGQEAKIAAIGVRVRKWISFHGIALNLNPDLKFFNSIIPCGISNFGVTSLSELGYNIEMSQLDKILNQQFIKIFGQ